MKEWRFKERFSDDLEEQLLFSRGIKTVEEKDKFFSPDYAKDLYDPFLMLGMDKAVERILEAVKKNQRTVIFGDYDADGVCGSAIFHDFFKKIGYDNFKIYIPNKNEEGYGLTIKAVNEFKNSGTDLIITIDCGITDHEDIARAKELGIDTVVIDHHEEINGLPPAVATVDPKQNKDNYPFKGLCGAGVAFKVVEAVFKKGGFSGLPRGKAGEAGGNIIEGWTKWLLDAVCIATVADMVPLLGENRVLVRYGLEVLKKTPRLGLLLLFEKLQVKRTEITEDDLAYLIAPRINTTGRLGNATLSLDLMTTQSMEEAKWLVERIGEKHQEQKEMVGGMFAEINCEIEAGGVVPEVIVLGNEKWPAALLGMICNKVLEKYQRPVFLWGKGDGSQIKGSARSDGSVNLPIILSKLGNEFFADYGGHILSAGFTLRDEKIADLKKALTHACEEIKKMGEGVADVLWIDKEVNLEDVDWNLWGVVEKFGPFGKSNEKPLFLFKELEVARAKSFGNGGKHLQLDFKKQNGQIVPAIGFFMNPARNAVSNGTNGAHKAGSVINLVASLERSSFKGYDELRLRINDFKIL